MLIRWTQNTWTQLGVSTYCNRQKLINTLFVFGMLVNCRINTKDDLYCYCTAISWELRSKNITPLSSVCHLLSILFFSFRTKNSHFHTAAIIPAVPPGFCKSYYLHLLNLFIFPPSCKWIANTSDSKFNGTDIFIVFVVSSFYYHSFLSVCRSQSP